MQLVFLDRVKPAKDVLVELIFLGSIGYCVSLLGLCGCFCVRILYLDSFYCNSEFAKNMFGVCLKASTL